VTGRHFAMLLLMAFSFGGFTLSGSSVQTISKDQMQGAVFEDDLSVPCPGEVFAALNKACRPNWATLVTPATAPMTSDRSQLALAVGVLAANGYVAVEAQDGQQVKNVGREIMSVAKSLGVSQSLLGRGNSLIEFADNNAWDALADELEATENEVKTTMVEQKDRDLVTLTSSAAWLRGLEIATAVVLSKESLQGAEILHQPALARHLASQLSVLPERMKKGVLVKDTAGALESTAALLETPATGPQEKENIRKIHDSASAMVKAILASPSKDYDGVKPVSSPNSNVHSPVGSNPPSTQPKP